MENSFSLDYSKYYLIYGAGGNGLKVHSLLQQSGCHVLGFIDQRAPKLSIVNGLPVFNPDSLSETNNKDSIVVIITIKNVFEHSKLALSLAKKGFSHCIYKPICILKNQAVSKKLKLVNSVHDSLIIHNTFPYGLVLPNVELKIILSPRNLCCIKKNKETLTAWLPVELLFNYKHSDAYENIPMANFFPLLDLYHLFDGKIAFSVDQRKIILSEFISYCSEWAKANHVFIDSDLVNSWISSRKQSFDQMQSIFERDFDFFIRNAPHVQLDSNLKFHLTNSGRNRVVFLIAKGYRYVPVEMTLDDYEKWYQQSLCQQILDYTQSNLIYSVNVAIPHPLLCDLPVDYPDFHKHVCFPISNYILKNLYSHAKEIFNGYSVVNREFFSQKKSEIAILPLFDFDGVLSRFLYSQGYIVFRSPCCISPYVALLDSLYEQSIPLFSSFYPVNIIILQDAQLNKLTSLSLDLSKIEYLIVIESEQRCTLQCNTCTFRFKLSLSNFYFDQHFFSIDIYCKEFVNRDE